MQAVIKYKAVFLLSVMCIWVFPASAQGRDRTDSLSSRGAVKAVVQVSKVLEINPSDLEVNLNPYSYFIEEGPLLDQLIEGQKQLDIDQIKKIQLSEWGRHKKSNYGPFKSAMWMQVHYKFLSPPKADYLLHLDVGIIEELDIYQFQGDQLLSEQHTGNKFGFAHRPINFPTYVFNLPQNLSSPPGNISRNVPKGAEINAQEVVYSVYLRVVQNHRFRVPLYLVNKDDFFERSQTQLVKLMPMYGAIFIIAAYNLMFFFITRKKAYLVLSLATAFYCLTYFNIRGFAFQYFWPDSVWFSKNSEYLLSSLAVIFCTLFGIEFLGLKKNAKVAYLACMVAVWASVLCILMQFARQYVFVMNFAPPVFLYSSVCFIFTGAYCWYKGIDNAAYFTLAWLGVTSATIYICASIIAETVTIEMLDLGLYAGVVLALLLSIAMASRIKYLEQNKIEEKEEFFSRISHELRTPINGILGSLDLMKQRFQSREDAELIGFLSSSAHNLHNLIGDILNFSESGNESFELREDFHSLRNLMRDISVYMKEASKLENIQFTVQIAANIPDHLCFDYQKFNLVLRKLLDNAIKYTKDGYVVLYVSELEREDGEIALRFSVRDCGLGIDARQMENIFKSFSQSENFFSRKHEGLGLGLSIVQRILELMESKIEVESRLSVGSHFHFDVCFEFRDGDVVIAEEEAGFGNLRVLYVEDNKVNQMVMKKLLEKAGCEVVLAENGKIGVAEVQAHEYDLVLMDCAMPVMNGFEATRLIRDCGYTELPVIAVTANAMEGDREKCLSAGMDEYVAKPVNKSLFFSVVHKTLNEKPGGGVRLH